METKTKKTLRNILILLLICLVVMGAAFWFSRTYLIVYPIDGTSMEPTVHDDDFVLLFRTHKVKYDDIIVFYSDTMGKYLVKRVIGLEGDRIDIAYSEEDGLFHVYRNGERLGEDYINEPMVADSTYHELSVTVPAGKVFFLGDNRLNSSDSHYGNFYADVDLIEGVAFLRYHGLDISFL